MKGSSNYLPLALLSLSVLLTSCASKEPTVSDSMTLYSPPTLHLKAGTVIQTSSGRYQSQTDEIWYSAPLYNARVLEALHP